MDEVAAIEDVVRRNLRHGPNKPGDCHPVQSRVRYKESIVIKHHASCVIPVRGYKFLINDVILKKAG